MCILNGIVIISPLQMLQGLQILIGRKLGLAALSLLSITDVVFDMTRTVYTIHGGADALGTIWDILEPSVAVIESPLPTYKALLGPTKKEKKTLYQHLSQGGGTAWDSR